MAVTRLITLMMASLAFKGEQNRLSKYKFRLVKMIFPVLEDVQGVAVPPLPTPHLPVFRGPDDGVSIR